MNQIKEIDSSISLEANKGITEGDPVFNDKKNTNDDDLDSYDYQEEIFLDKQRKLNLKIQDIKEENEKLKSQIRTLQTKIRDSKVEIDRLKEHYNESQSMRITAANLILS